MLLSLHGRKTSRNDQRSRTDARPAVPVRRKPTPQGQEMQLYSELVKSLNGLTTKTTFTSAHGDALSLALEILQYGEKKIEKWYTTRQSDTPEPIGFMGVYCGFEDELHVLESLWTYATKTHQLRHRGEIVRRSQAFAQGLTALVEDELEQADITDDPPPNEIQEPPVALKAQTAVMAETLLWHSRLLSWSVRWQALNYQMPTVLETRSLHKGSTRYFQLATGNPWGLDGHLQKIAHEQVFSAALMLHRTHDLSPQQMGAFHEALRSATSHMQLQRYIELQKQLDPIGLLRRDSLEVLSPEEALTLAVNETAYFVAMAPLNAILQDHIQKIIDSNPSELRPFAATTGAFPPQLTLSDDHWRRIPVANGLHHIMCRESDPINVSGPIAFPALHPLDPSPATAKRVLQVDANFADDWLPQQIVGVYFNPQEPPKLCVTQWVHRRPDGSVDVGLRYLPGTPRNDAITRWDGTWSFHSMRTISGLVITPETHEREDHMVIVPLPRKNEKRHFKPPISLKCESDDRILRFAGEFICLYDCAVLSYLPAHSDAEPIT